jgi:glycosyltransferase involved in cell wall biosynthesis
LDAPQLTVIVACYNLAPFLPACLRSIFRQPLADRVTVLIVDDGSVDNSRDVARAEIAAHPHVRCGLVTQTNQGVSAARNHGLRLVRTPYVTFLDADDYWQGNYLEKVMPILDEGRSDIIAFNARFVDMTGRRVLGMKSHTLFPGRSCTQMMADAAEVGEWHCYTRIFRTQLLDGEAFPAGRYYEDAALVPLLYAKASRIEAIDEELYTYLRRPGSLTSSVSEKHIDDLLLNAREERAHPGDKPDFWSAVHRRTMLLIASEIGRAPRERRRAMLARTWPEVRAKLQMRWRLRWILKLVDGCLRSEVKRLIGRDTSARASGSVSARRRRTQA